MSCDCDHEDDDDENGEEKKYEAYMQAGQMGVQAEGESSAEAEERVKRLWDKAIEDVKSLNDDERRSVGLK